MFRQLIVIIFLLIGTATGYAQSSDTVRILSIEFKDRDSNTMIQADTELVIAGERLEWKQDHGNYVRTFNINNTIGTWADVYSNGTIVFNVSDEDATGTCKIVRVDETTIVLLDLISPGNDIRLQISVLNLSSY